MMDKNDEGGMYIPKVYKVGFKTMSVIRDKRGLFRIIKGSIPEEGIKIIKLYVPNSSVSKCVEQKLTEIKDKIGNSINIVQNFSICLCLSHREMSEE